MSTCDRIHLMKEPDEQNEIMSDEHANELIAAYWAEEEEMKAGVHPSQIIPKIEELLRLMSMDPALVTMYDWNTSGHTVIVSYENKKFGIFNYDKDCFEYYFDDSATTPGQKIVNIQSYAFVKFSGSIAHKVSVIEEFYKRLSAKIYELSNMDDVVSIDDAVIDNGSIFVSKANDLDNPVLYSDFFGDVKSVPLKTSIITMYAVIPFRKIVVKG